MRKSWRIAASLLFLAVLLGGSLVGDRLLALSDDARQQLRAYTELLDAAQAHYGADVEYKDLVYGSINGMTRQLDPHTTFLPPEAYTRMRDRQQASFYGLGILVGMRDGALTVIAPLEGTPASRMGLRAGDIITHIEGEPTDDLTVDDAVSKLKGPKDTQVTITIARRGASTPFEVTITRAEIPLTTVRYIHMMDDETGYFRVTEFSRSTGKEVQQAIAQLKAQGMKRLLMDLRNNGGGLLDQAIEVADQFVPRDTLIVETKGRLPDSHQRYMAEGAHQPLDMPVVVLVNSGSASASEILAGAIQDHDIGVIVGTPTWGKGLVQTVYGLPYGAALALTTANYYTPSGRLIQRDYTSFYDYYARSEAPAEPAEGPGSAIEDAQPDLPDGDEPVFFTDLGRKVYGGGGITPDVIVPARESHELMQFLTIRNAFFEFGVDYSSRHEVDSVDWQPDPDVLTEFEEWLIEQDLGEPAEIDAAFADEATRAEAANRIRAEIFNSRFGNDAWYRVLTENDNQIQAALGEFARAQEILAQRHGLDDNDRVARTARREDDRKAAAESAPPASPPEPN